AIKDNTAKEITSKVLSQFQSIPPQKCADAMARLYCLAIFTKCVKVSESESIQYFPCQNVCDDVTKACNDEGEVSWSIYSRICLVNGEPLREKCNDGKGDYTWSSIVAGILAIVAIIIGICFVVFLGIYAFKKY